MFYNDNLLSRKGPFGSIWTAAHWERRLTKAQVVSTDLEHSVQDLVNGKMGPMALRLSGRLLLGVTRIYSRKTKYLLEDCSEALNRLQRNLRKDDVDLPAGTIRAAVSTITIATAPVEEVLAPEPELDVEALLRELDEEEEAEKRARQSQNRSWMEVEGARSVLPLLRESEVPSELQIELDKLGSRIDLMSPITNHHRQSIEVGRRAVDSPRDSLPFSPLRTPSKKTAKDLPYEEIPVIPDYDPYESYEGAGIPPQEAMGEAANRSSEIPPMPLHAVEHIAQTLTVRKAPRRVRNKPTPLDNQIEFSLAEMQETIKNPLLLLLQTRGQHCTLLSGVLSWLSLDNPPVRESQRKSAASAALNNHQAAEQDLRDEDFVLGPADYAMDGVGFDENIMIPRSPKSPRIMNDDDDAENTVPQINNKLPSSMPNTPTKSGTKVYTGDGASTILPEDTIVTLTDWQQALHLDKYINFNELIPADARKRTVADTFLKLLVLQTRDFVKGEQQVPYDVIKVQAKDRLFSITAETVNDLEQQ